MDDTVPVRVLVRNVPASVAFYTANLGFVDEGSQSPAFASVRRGNLVLLLSGEGSSAARGRR